MPRTSYPTCQSNKYHGAAPSRHFASSSSVSLAADTLTHTGHGCSSSEEPQQGSSRSSALHVSARHFAWHIELTQFWSSLQRVLPVHPGAPSLRYRRRHRVQPVHIMRRTLVPPKTSDGGGPHPLRIWSRRCSPPYHALAPIPSNWIQE